MKVTALFLSLLLTSSTCFAGTNCIEGDSISYREIQELTPNLEKCTLPVLVAAEKVVLTLLHTWQKEQPDTSGLRSLPVLVAIAGAIADLALIRQEMAARKHEQALKDLAEKTAPPTEEKTE